MTVPDAIAAEVLARCVRHCCVCRRFRPLHLQVHHIRERSDGGTDDLDNLIAVCVSCHCDVHTQTKLTKRFTEQELKLHRDAVYRLVADGRMPAASDELDSIAGLSASIVSILRALRAPTRPETPLLIPEAVEILLAAVRSNSPIEAIDEAGSFAVLVREAEFGECFDQRASAKYRHAVRQLENSCLIEGHAGLYCVSYTGFLVADDILSAGAS